MKIIISPAKKMNENTDFFPAEEIPAFTERTKILLEKIKSLTCQEAREVWQCNQIAVYDSGRLGKFVGYDPCPYGLRGDPVPVSVPHDL